MSWYRTGTVTVATGSKNVTGVGTLWASSVNVGDAFALVDANGNPTGAWYEVELVTSNTALVLKQTYTGTPAPGSNKQYAVFNLVGNMTTPSFAQRLAQFFDQFQDLVDLPTTTPTASSIPIADSGGKIADGWIPATVARTASPTLTGTPAAPTAPKATNTTQLATTAHVKSVVADYTPLATLLGAGLGSSVGVNGPADANTLVATGFWTGPGAAAVNWGIAAYGFMIVSRRTNQVFQIAIRDTASEMKLRVASGAGETWGSWNSVSFDGHTHNYVPKPTSIYLTVGSVAILYNTGDAVANESSVAGSTLKQPHIAAGGISGVGVMDGTWKNISGGSIPASAAGLFLRTA